MVVVLLALNLRGTHAKYQTSESVPLTRGTVNYKVYDFKIMAMYQENESGEYDEVEAMPTSGYVINEDKSYCYTKTQEEHDDTVSMYTIKTGEHVFGNLKKNSKCYLWFDEYKIPVSETILAGKTISERTSFNAVVTASSTGTVYSAEDDDGESYYYAGAATDNYVYFAGYYWRIIRVNGDGTVRLIYDGTSARANGTKGTDTLIGEIEFNNSNYNNNMSVGFRYTSGSVHGVGTASTISEALDTWYTSSGLSSYANYIDTNAGFCGDRTPYTDTTGTTSGGGTEGAATYYAGYIRLQTNKTPSLKCTESSDLYTVNGARKGNKSLSNPIGLISADEVSYAGGVSKTNNTSYYLYTGNAYWTMSPYQYGGGTARMFYVYTGGALNYADVNGAFGVRPVINLRSDLTLSGTGTSSDPYIPELS